MKTAALLVCLVGSALAIPVSPPCFITRTPEHENNGDLLSNPRNKNQEVPLTATEPRPARTQGGSSNEHEAYNSPKSSNFLSPHIKMGSAPDRQDGDSGSSSGEQVSSEYHQLRRPEKHNNERIWDDEGRLVDARSAQNAWTYNKDRVDLSENKRDGDEEGKVEEEERERVEETIYRDMKHQTQLTNHNSQYKREQDEEGEQPDEITGDSRQPLQITKRHGEKLDREEHERDETQPKPHESEKIPLSQKSSSQHQDDGQQSQQGKANSHAHKQNVDDDDHDGDVDGEEDLSSVWKKNYAEGGSIQSDKPVSISAEWKGDSKDGSARSRDNGDDLHATKQDFAHFEEDDHHELLDSDSKEQKETSSSVQSVNSVEPEHKVKATSRSYGEGESASNSSGKALLDACRNFHCKRGKVCHVDEQEQPRCICQDPAACPSTKDYEHVCGTDNKTYEGLCQLFGTKCQLDGTKMGRQLHLDYMGSCKFIPHCTDYEVDQFPLRMRDWLKNILMQYYERDVDTSGFLTEKQRNKVKKIYENEKRLSAGDHPVELLLYDFEKNYHMYVYPVHWQFYQLDQHPVDRVLSHSELAPLRASLVPMEHCITRFFQECDGDQDKRVSLKEWCHCFGIKREDIDENLLF
uniref:SPARC like 1 n=1 Tax=Nothoprocta perdicaria TaxID=30464 RepID=A0A8C6ZBP8_NOTPE